MQFPAAGIEHFELRPGSLREPGSVPSGPMVAPNILLVMSDQHRADMLGSAGDPSVQTPAIDALANEGARFTRVSCQGPLCMPSRASFMTERYVRDHGVYTNWEEIGSDVPTYVRALREAGYHTALLGKAHLYLDEKLDARHIDDVAWRLEALGFSEVLETGDKFVSKIPSRYTDFLSGRGLLEAYMAHIRERSYQGENEDGRNATKSVPMWDSTPMPIPLDSYVDSWHGAEAVRWIEHYERSEPFFLFVGFPGPHDPWDAPAEALDRYRDTDISMPRSTLRPVVDGTGRYGALLNSFLWLSDSTSMTDDAIRGMRRSYAADISVIDDAVGAMVDALRRRSLLDSTWIVYTSDHGEMAGTHGLMSKCVLYEPAMADAASQDVVANPMWPCRKMRRSSSAPARNIKKVSPRSKSALTCRSDGRSPGHRDRPRCRAGTGSPPRARRRSDGAPPR
jgi:choline-sulfatase